MQEHTPVSQRTEWDPSSLWVLSTSKVSNCAELLSVYMYILDSRMLGYVPENIFDNKCKKKKFDV